MIEINSALLASINISTGPSTFKVRRLWCKEKVTNQVSLFIKAKHFNNYPRLLCR